MKNKECNATLSKREFATALMKGVMAFCLFALLPFTVSAQKLEAEKSTIDVGRTGYQVPITATFEFRNKGHRQLRISKVSADCRCTLVEYPISPIGHNESFTVKMTYDARQLGHFAHQAAIISNASDKPFYITMKGIVQADYVDLSGTYPVEMGDMRLDKDVLEFDDVNKGFEQVQELLIYNNGSRVCEPNLMHLPAYLTATVVPQQLPPNRAGKITVTLHSEKLHDYGLTQTSVFLAANPGDKVSPDHEIDVSAVLLPAFDGMTEAQRQQAPRLSMSKQTIDIAFAGKKKQSDVILLTNEGQSMLDISSLQMFTGGLRVSLNKSKLAPGETAKLKVTAMRDELLKLRRRPRILMITNDPNHGKIVIEVRAN